jgi:hypothetical protein
MKIISISIKNWGTTPCNSQAKKRLMTKTQNSKLADFSNARSILSVNFSIKTDTNYDRIDSVVVNAKDVAHRYHPSIFDKKSEAVATPWRLDRTYGRVS